MKPFEKNLKFFLDNICPGKPFDENDKSKNCDECLEYVEGFCEHPEHPSIKQAEDVTMYICPECRSHYSDNKGEPCVHCEEGGG